MASPRYSLPGRLFVVALFGACPFDTVCSAILARVRLVTLGLELSALVARVWERRASDMRGRASGAIRWGQPATRVSRRRSVQVHGWLVGRPSLVNSTSDNLKYSTQHIGLPVATSSAVSSCVGVPVDVHFNW